MVCWTAVSGPAPEIRIGEHDARVVLEEGWRWQTLSPDLGEYQFTVREFGGLFF